MVILADAQREIGSLKNANVEFDVNNKKMFTVQIARCYWTQSLTFDALVYVPDTEYGGIIGSVLTDTTLDYVELKGYTWRGMLEHKIIQPPAGSDYKKISGELNEVLKTLIEPEFDGLFVVSQKNTGVFVSNYQFSRYCTLLDGIVEMLASRGYRLEIRHKREEGVPGYVLISAVPVENYSDQVELSKDCSLNYTMEDSRNGINHLIVAGKGELADRTVYHLYVWPDGSFREEPYYTGLDEIAEVYENTSTETAELKSKAVEKLKEICNKKTFDMDIEKLGIDVAIGDVISGRDYLTGMAMKKSVGNIVYSVTNGIISKEYKLEGD